jgi:hypothetical protein
MPSTAWASLHLACGSVASGVHGLYRATADVEAEQHRRRMVEADDFKFGDMGRASRPYFCRFNLFVISKLHGNMRF